MQLLALIREQTAARWIVAVLLLGGFFIGGCTCDCADRDHPHHVDHDHD